MKILMVNKFFWLKGGSEKVFFEEAELLKNMGHELIFFSMKDEKNSPSNQNKYFVNHINYESVKGFTRGISQSIHILYSLEANRKIKWLLNNYHPDIVHLHNIHHQISPSILDVINEHRIPIVMTLHDYKLVCPVYSLLSGGKPCQKCMSGKYFWCLLKKCNKGSYKKSLINVAEMYLHHLILHIYNKINVFISPSVFLKEKIREMGFKRELIYLPNFIKLEEFKPCYKGKQRSIIYFGRLSPEKGILTLMQAVKGMDITLKIIGDGPLKGRLENNAQREGLNNVIFSGYKNGKELKHEIQNALFVVLPSECYENNPRTIIEAFALGKPVIGSRIGGIPELVKDGQMGLTFEPGNVEDQKNKIKYMINNPKKVGEMGRKARNFVERELNPEKHYNRLMEIYQIAMEN